MVSVALLYPVNVPVPEVVDKLVVDIALGVSVAKTSFTKNSKSCFSPDPNNNSESYVLCIGTNKASVVKTSDNSTVDISYPSGLNAVGGQALQAFNKVFIFRDGKVSLEWNGVLTGTPAFTQVETILSQLLQQMTALLWL